MASHGSDLPAGAFAARFMATHVIAYFLAGLLALLTLRYEERFAAGALGQLMRPLDDPWVAAGAGMQIVNGLALGIALAPFRGVLLGPRGALHLFALLVGFSLFSPQTPGPGNLEGLMYTRVPLAMHLLGLPEVLAYSALASAGVVGWCRAPSPTRDAMAGVLVALVVGMSALGVLDALGWLPAG